VRGLWKLSPSKRGKLHVDRKIPRDIDRWVKEAKFKEEKRTTQFDLKSPLMGMIKGESSIYRRGGDTSA